MKKFALLMALAMVLGVSVTAFAYPTLQLDISDGVYDSATQTVFATQDAFTLYALLNPDSTYTPGLTYYISAALVPSLDAIEGGDYGSFLFGNDSIAATGDMTFGTPGDDTRKALASHGIYSDYYVEKSFTFDTANKASAYDMESAPGGFTASTNGSFYYEAFSVDTSLLKQGYGIHFDFYAKDASGKVVQNAPFSHDAQSLLTRITATTPTDPGTAGDPPGTNPTPEPATMVLLGIGLMGIAVVGRKAKK